MTSVLSPIQLGLGLLYTVLGQYQSAGAPASIIENIQGAIASLEAAHGQEVVASGLEALRVTIPAPDWSNIPPVPDSGS